jgi:enterochelin esterase-like enzyme
LNPAQTASGAATMFTAPASTPSGGTVQITAASAADPNKSISYNIAIGSAAASATAGCEPVLQQATSEAQLARKVPQSAQVSAAVTKRPDECEQPVHRS